VFCHKNCGRACRICAYGKLDPIGYDVVRRSAETLMRQGYRVHLYDFHIGPQSIAVFRRTRQFEGRNPGWMNVGPDFDPSPDDLGYVNSLRTVIAISLHGSSAEVHRVASGKNDWHAIVDFIRRYPTRYRLPLGVNYVVGKHNLGDLPAMIDLCRGFDVDFLELIPLGYSGNAVGQLGADAVLSSEEKRHVWQVVNDHTASVHYALELDDIWGPDFANEPVSACRIFAAPLPNSYCNAGVNHWAIRLNDMQVFPCPCMAGIDAMAVGSFDGTSLRIDDDWLARRERIAEPCRSCDEWDICQGGCRLTAMSDHRVRHGTYDRYAGFEDCLHLLTKRDH
jgi:radical SAM protein with 4Fe4S-binding SPASM domain